MTKGFTRLAAAHPRWVLGGWAVVVLALGVLGAGVATTLQAGGFVADDAESSLAAEQLEHTFDRGGMTLVFAVTADGDAQSASARAAGQSIAAGLKGDPLVTSVVSLWGEPQLAGALRSRDGSTGLVVAGVRGGDDDGAENSRELAEKYGVGTDGAEVSVGGDGIVYDTMNVTLKKDLLIAELIAVPITFLVLIWVFGSVVSALIPAVVGVGTIVATAGILRLLSEVTGVSIFALNLTAALGLALAIDYSLLIVNRFRQECASGSDPVDAMQATMATAGRTVLFSAVIVGLSLAAMVAFPIYFMRSFAYAGVAVVIFTAAVTMVVTPAIILLLGDRLDALSIKALVRRRTAAAKDKTVEQGGWFRLTHGVMRRAPVIAVTATVLLLVLGAPFLGLRLDYPDDRVLPSGVEARDVADQLRDDFDQSVMGQTQIVVPDGNRVSADLDSYAAQLSTVAGVAATVAPGGAFVRGEKVGFGDPGAVAGDSAMVTVSASTGVDAARLVGDLHAVRAPAETLFYSQAQHDRDAVDAIVTTLPWVLAVIAILTFGILFLLTGSVVLPIKALLMNVLSLSAVFGFVVWVFRDGNLGGFGTTATGSLVAIIPVLMFCVAFGLSMDYEVFLLARIKEQWDRAPDRSRKSNEDAVAYGLAYTARVVTAAAILVAIVFAALGSSSVALMRMFGVGMALAVVLDATIVRVLPVPSFMKVLGPLNWWAPRPLARLHSKFGIRD